MEKNVLILAALGAGLWYLLKKKPTETSGGAKTTPEGKVKTGPAGEIKSSATTAAGDNTTSGDETVDTEAANAGDVSKNSFQATDDDIENKARDASEQAVEDGHTVMA